MIVNRVARRYAEAIYESIPDSPGVDLFLEDLSDLRQSLDSSRELRRFFKSPVIAEKLKLPAIEELFVQRLSRFTVDMLVFLTRKRREQMILEIIVGIFEIHRQRCGILPVHVKSTLDLSPSQKDRLVGSLAASSGKTIEPDYLLDPDILGGVVVRVGDTVYDGSIYRQLQLLREAFLAGAA